MTSSKELHQTIYLCAQVGRTNAAFTENTAVVLVYRYEDSSVATYVQYISRAFCCLVCILDTFINILCVSE